LYDLGDLVKCLSVEEAVASGLPFKPSAVDLDSFITDSEAPSDEEEMADVVDPSGIMPQALELTQTRDMTVIAIDSTAFCLGEIPEGVVGAVRCSLISSSPGQETTLESYGPYIFALTNQNRQAVYSSLYTAIYGVELKGRPPTPYFLLHRIRHLFERRLQQAVAAETKNSLILLDGSLIGGTIANPKQSVQTIIKDARENKSIPVAVSKATVLTLRDSERSIISLLDAVPGCCFVTGLRKRISQSQEKYCGEISVARLTPFGQAFRIDTDPDNPLSTKEILGLVSTRAAEDGYPEELRLAHMTCVFSAIELLELQAAAMNAYMMRIREDPHHTLFPL
jgi:hypothetical protein